MKTINRMYVAIKERKGQTMTEYVLILAAIALAGYLAYVALAGGITGLITKVTDILNAA